MSNVHVNTITRICNRYMLVLSCLLWQGCGAAPPKELPPTHLSVTDLRFGSGQVDQMLKDRPELARYTDKEDIVYKWAARQFAGEAVGQRVYWSSDLPDCPASCMAASSGADNGIPGFIRVRERYAEGARKGQKVDSDSLWSSIVFELFNLRSDREFNLNLDKAMNGEISRKEWVVNLTKLEFRAVNRTAEFYRTTYGPWAKQKGIVADEVKWYQYEPRTYPEWINKFKDPAGYPFTYYKYYDAYIAPHLKK